MVLLYHIPGVPHRHDGSNEKGLVPYLGHDDDRDGGSKAMEELVLVLRLVQLFDIVQLQRNYSITI